MSLLIISTLCVSSRRKLVQSVLMIMQDLCRKYDIPTARYEVFNSPDKAKAYIRQQATPIVVKADGLAAGKGVIVAASSDEACAAVDDMLVNKAFGSAGQPSLTPAVMLFWFRQYTQGRQRAQGSTCSPHDITKVKSQAVVYMHCCVCA